MLSTENFTTYVFVVQKYVPQNKIKRWNSVDNSVIEMLTVFLY